MARNNYLIPRRMMAIMQKVIFTIFCIFGNFIIADKVGTFLLYIEENSKYKKGGKRTVCYFCNNFIFIH